MNDDPPRPPSFAQALRFWSWLGLVNFGGPAGQIALMHEQVVEKRRWLDHARFMHALSFCTLLPGPEAMQLATYVGWLFHGTLGGLAAGILFVLPGAILILLLSILYSLYGDVGWVKGVFYGLGPAVIAIVAAAVLRIGRKTLDHPALRVVAAAAFVSIFFFSVPFPTIVAAAILLGLCGARWRPGWFRPRGHEGGAGEPAAAAGEDTFDAAHTRPSRGRAARVLAVWGVLWWVPVIGLGAWRGWSDDFFAMAVFFSMAAVVTFGGAYAVLSYVAQAAVTRFSWLTPPDMTVGLGLAETTPGPLILVVEFVGYMAGFNHPPAGWPPVAGGILGAALTLWVTFVPCFLWIFLGAPFVERLRGHRPLDAALGAVSAAVVGVILNLAVWLALRVLFRVVREERFGLLTLNLPDLRTTDLLALAMAAAGFIGILRFRWNMVAVVLGSAGIGLASRLL